MPSHNSARSNNTTNTSPFGSQRLDSNRDENENSHLDGNRDGDHDRDRDRDRDGDPEQSRRIRIRTIDTDTTTDSTWTVYDLNTRGCVSVLRGNFSAANQFLHNAMDTHKRVGERQAAAEAAEAAAAVAAAAAAVTAAAASTVLPCHSHTVQQQQQQQQQQHDCSVSDDCYDPERSQSDYDNDYDDNDYDNDYDYDYDDSDYDSEMDDSDMDDSDMDDSDHGAFSLDPLSYDHTPIQRLTTTSTVRTASYCGWQQYQRQRQRQHQHQHQHQKHSSQQHPQDQSDNHDFFHQVYRLPIVMDEDEWKQASVHDKSFVLIFNTALSHHLCGMEMLEKIRHHQFQFRSQFQSQSQSQSQYCHQLLQLLDADHASYREFFWTARTLYRLALQSLSNSVVFRGRGTNTNTNTNTNTTVCCIDKLCLAAMYNNLSHVYKALDGSHSVEGRSFDRLLLGFIFWRMETTSIDNNSRRRTQPQPPILGTTTTTTAEAEASGTDDYNTTSQYRDEDSEIIDAFLDTVFYLIGAPETIVPAAAA